MEHHPPVPEAASPGVGPVAAGAGLEPATLGPGAAPVTPTERIDTLDVVRGFALFGILAVNMAFFNQPIYHLLSGPPPAATPLDWLAGLLIRWLAESKFYSLFAFLFGLGLVLQMQRTESRGGRFGPLYRRRMAVLLLIGLVHALLFWVGDILVTYAVVGSLLMLFRHAQPRWLLVLAVTCLLLPLLLSAVGIASLELARLVPTAAAEIERSLAAEMADLAARTAAAGQVYASGNFLAVTQQRFKDWSYFLPYLLVLAPSVFGMFLLGVAAARRGIVQNLPAHRPLLLATMRWGLGLGLPLNLVYALASEAVSRVVPGWLSLLAQAALTAGAPLLSLGYAAGLALLLLRPGWSDRLAPLQAAGRLALSNYLLQSTICTLIFYGYGLGRFGQVQAAGGLLLTLVIYAGQLLLSGWWLGHFASGPVEWLWRSLSYGRWQRLRLNR